MGLVDLLGAYDIENTEIFFGDWSLWSYGVTQYRYIQLQLTDRPICLAPVALTRMTER